MTSTTLSILIAICLIGVIGLQTVTATSALQVPYHLLVMEHHYADDQKEAERLWEQAISAKGGRERLYAVNNVVISTEKDTSGLLTKIRFVDYLRVGAAGIRAENTEGRTTTCFD